MDTNNDDGWVKLYRKSIHSQVFQNEGLWKVWTWCLLKANHDDNWVSIKTGRGRSEVFVKRGQFIFGRKTAAKELRMVERTVHKRMLKLKTMRNCDIQSDTHYSIITICNYNAYQAWLKNEVTGEVTGKGQASDTNNNDNNEKKVKKGSSAKKTADPRVKEFLTGWGEIFLRQTGQPYTFSYGKEGKLIKSLIQVHSLETLREMLWAFFQDEQCKRRGLNIGIFFQEINRLVSIKGLSPVEMARRDAERRVFLAKREAQNISNPVDRLRELADTREVE